MSRVWLPLSAEMDRRRRHEAQLAQMVETKGVLDQWNRELKQIDPYLEMVRFKDDAKRLPGVKPGYFAVVRHNPGAPPSILTISGDRGECVEPTSRVFVRLREQDWWSDSATYERKKRARALELAEQRQEERERAERVEEYGDRLKALTNPGISMTGQGRGWKHRAGARTA